MTYAKLIGGYVLVALVFITIALLIASPAPAQEALPAPTECGSTEAIRAVLEDGFGEEAGMVLANGSTQIVEVYINSDTQSWTIIVSTTDGTSCVAGFGVGYLIDISTLFNLEDVAVVE